MVRTAYPYRSVVFQFMAAFAYPRSIKQIHIFRRSTFIPFTFVHTHNFSTLYTYPTITQKIRRVGKYHIELETELF